MRGVKCPTCRSECAWDSNPQRPFCSERCRLIDLGQWADEAFRIPGAPVPEEDLEQVFPFTGSDDHGSKE